MGNDVTRQPRARAKGFGHARGQAGLAWLVIFGGATTCALAVATRLAPDAHPMLERAAGVLGRAGLETSVLVLSGVGAVIAGLVLRAVSRFGRLLDGDREAAIAIDELSRAAQGHARAVESVREDVGALRGELARTQHAVDEHVQWSHSQAQENPVFRLAASLDQLWARIDQSVMAARDELTHEVRNSTVALRKVDDDALQQTAERIERGLVCVTQSIEGLRDHVQGAVDAAERAVHAAGEATSEARRTAEQQVELSSALAELGGARPADAWEPSVGADASTDWDQEPPAPTVEATFEPGPSLELPSAAAEPERLAPPSGFDAMPAPEPAPEPASEPASEPMFEPASEVETPFEPPPEPATAVSIEFDAAQGPSHGVEAGTVEGLDEAFPGDDSAVAESQPIDPLAETLAGSFDPTHRPAPEAWDFEPQEPAPPLPAAEAQRPVSEAELEPGAPRILHLQTDSEFDGEPLSIEVQLDSAFEDKSELEVPPPLPSERPEGLDLLERLDASRPLTVSREDEAPPLFPDLENGGDTQR